MSYLKRETRRHVFSFVAGLALFWSSPTGAMQGVVLDEVGKGSALELAGIAAGDVAMLWERPATAANPRHEQDLLISPFDWLWIEIEQASRGSLLLLLERSGQVQHVTIRPGPWVAKVRPQLPKSLESKYLAADAAASRNDNRTAALLFGDLAQALHERGALNLWHNWVRMQAAKNWIAAKAYKEAISELDCSIQETADPFARAVLWETVATAHEQAGDLDSAKVAYQEALKLKESLPGSELSTARTLHALCVLLRDEGKLNEAQNLCQTSLAIRSRLAPASLEEAAGLKALGNVLLTFGDTLRARDLHERALAIHERIAPNTLMHAGSLSNVGMSSADNQSALDHLHRALKIQERLASESLATADILSNIGTLLKSQDKAAARRYYERALALQDKLVPNGHDAAATLMNIGILCRESNELGQAERYLLHALEINSRLSPGSLHYANNLLSLGLVAANKGDLDVAEGYYLRALELQEKNAPGGEYVATTLNNLGLIAYERGDLQRAEGYHRRSLQIREQLGSSKVSGNLNNLGLVALERGDLEMASDYFKRSLRLKESAQEGPARLIPTIANLGLTAWARRDLASAREHLERALALQERLATGTLDSAAILTNIGGIAFESGNLVEARQRFERALEIARAISPNSMEAGRSYHNLGDVEWLEDKKTLAVAYWKKSLAIFEKQAPAGLDSANALDNLAEAMAEGANLDEALKLRTQALALRRKLSPGSLGEAESEFGLADVLQRMGRLEEAGRHFENAAKSLEQQIGRLGGSRETREEYGAHYRHFYRRWIELLLRQGKAAQAFYVFERSRARSLLTMLRERDLGFVDAPEIEFERQRLAREYDRVQGELAHLQPRTDWKRIEEIQHRLKLIRDRYIEALEQLRRISPKLAALEAPVPLTEGEAQEALDSGTILLAYSLGKSSSHIFTLSELTELRVASIPVGEEQIREVVQDFRSLLTASTARGPSDLRMGAMNTIGRQLFNLLIAPVAENISLAKRVLVIPDGPLHLLPWGALVRDSQPAAQAQRNWTLLAEWKPIHIALSATVYAELRTARLSSVWRPVGASLAAFGDPAYLTSAALEAERPRPTVERSFSFSPLPFTRIEVERIAELYRSESTRIYLGADASEENAKALPRSTDIIHFAVHASINEYRPLDSGVALSIPTTLTADRDNGLLQAWEVLERVRVDASLVTLSACDSGLGKEMGGEGLIGLTRAFQYAGARSVIASLWKISDRTTAEFMVRFYRHLKEGLSKDEALRATQTEFIRGPIQVTNDKGEQVEFDASAPYYWAAFQIYGDWQ